MCASWLEFMSIIVHCVTLRYGPAGHKRGACWRHRGAPMENMHTWGCRPTRGTWPTGNGWWCSERLCCWCCCYCCFWCCFATNHLAPNDVIPHMRCSTTKPFSWPTKPNDPYGRCGRFLCTCLSVSACKASNIVHVSRCSWMNALECLGKPIPIIYYTGTELEMARAGITAVQFSRTYW